MKFNIKLATVSLFISTFSTSYADGKTALELLDNYNLITSGNVYSSSEVDGNALIGGNLSGNSNYNIHNIVTSFPSLTVAGNILSSSNINVNNPGLDVTGSIQGNVTVNGGNDYIGSISSGGSLTNNANGNGASYILGNIAGTVNTNGGTTFYQGSLTGSANGTVVHENITAPFSPASVVSNAISTLTSFSQQLDNVAKTSNYSLSNGTLTFNAGSNGISVFTINGAENIFQQVSQIQFNLTNSQEILINVINSNPADLLTINANLIGTNLSLASNVLWNFENVDNLTINRQLLGSVLAIGANVIVNGDIEGTLVTNALLQYQEIHYHYLNVQFSTLYTTNSAVPELPIFMLMSLGLVLIQLTKSNVTSQS